VVPKDYYKFLDVFSKEESDKLLRYRSYDYKIILEESELRLGFSPLRNHSREELLALRQYILEYKSKDFIRGLKAPHAAPILFVRKKDGSLRLCVDYRKLNAIIRKDRYPLLLIQETLGRIMNSKIFIRLDVRQAFNRIRIDLASEELTTFRIRYGTYCYKVLLFSLTNGPATF
jgi:hypothetical protein